MHLRCPRCQKKSRHARGDVLGQWVICPVCERPFAWREAPPGRERRNGNNPEEQTRTINPPRGEEQ